MKKVMRKWRKLLNENAYSFGTFGVNVASGHIASQCPQGEEQNGMDEFGEPICRPKPKIKEKKKLFKKAKIQPYNFDWGLLGEGDNLIIPTRKGIIDYIVENPDQKIHLDNPKGSVKKFGGKTEVKLPFDYGEWPNLINPEDNMGWDLIIVPSATKDNNNLIPVGYVAYNELKPESMGNDKIIIAPNKIYSSRDRKVIEDVFSKMNYFDQVVWL